MSEQQNKETIFNESPDNETLEDVTPERENEEKTPVTVKPKRRYRMPVKTLCYCALLVALGVIANTFTIYFNFAGSNALAFTYTVCFIAGAFFGPFAGFIVGACGDVIGWLINPAGGAFNPLLTLTSGLLGLIPGLVFFIAKKLLKDKKKYDRFFPVFAVASYVLVWAVCTNLNTVIFFYSYIYGKSLKYSAFGAYYVYRIPFQTLFWACNLVLSVLLGYPLKKILKL